MQRHRIEAAANIVVRIIFGPAHRERLQSRFRLRGGRTRFESADCREESIVAIFDDLSRHGDGAPEIDLAPEQRIREARRHYADDRNLLSVEPDAASHDLRIA